MRLRCRVGAALLGVLAAAAGTVHPNAHTPRVGGPAGARPQTAFKSDTDLVVLHVTVFNERSDAVPDLPQSAFQIFEDGEPQEIAFFSGGDVPVAVGLVLDGSASMITRRRMVMAGADAFIRTRHPEDELFTIHFNEHVQFGLPATVPFTSRWSLLQAAVSHYQAAGRTALHDAVIAGLDHLEQATHQKRVLVVLSDGKDNASRQTRDDMLNRARRSDAIVYTVSSANRRNGLESDPRVLRRLARVSGGVAYFPDSDDEVVESFDEIGGNVRRGYLIGYLPPNGAHDGGFRRVRVAVRAPGRAKLTARSREGYDAHAH
ncbi:MAG: VWA domain-containing protein [Acidobacteria bacterium]|nr:VWA domain-containing protein [Acidobacteriota bacterium]